MGIKTQSEETILGVFAKFMRVVFLDRDGVINKFPGHGNYVTKVKDFHFLPGALEALRLLTEMGYSVFIVSNQAGVARGVYSYRKLKQITDYMLRHVRKAGGRIKEAMYCIHRADENCDCRKPKIGSIRKAFQSMNKPMRHAKKTFFVGDVQSDILAGHNAGCTTIFVLSGLEDRRSLRRWSVQPDYIARDLLDAVKVITRLNSNHSKNR